MTRKRDLENLGSSVLKKESRDRGWQEGGPDNKPGRDTGNQVREGGSYGKGQNRIRRRRKNMAQTKEEAML